jgi:hypothetical protein
LLACSLRPGTTDAANPCWATLAPDLKLHIPALSTPAGLLAVDLDYSPTGPTPEPAIWFKLAGSGASALTTCSYPATLFTEDATLVLRIPAGLHGAVGLWAELEHVPTDDGHLWGKVRNFGNTPHQVFVTSVKGTGNLGSWGADAGGKAGVDAGDAICQARAEAAGLPGVFRAWLSDADSDAYCRIHGLPGKKATSCGQGALPAVPQGPWIRTDGFPFVESIEGILDDGRIFVPARTDEFGQQVPARTRYFTNTHTDGAAFSAEAALSCASWTSAASTSSALTGHSDRTSEYWTWYTTAPCATSLPLLCFQAGAGPPLPPANTVGKKVFLTSTIGTGNLSAWPDAAASGATGVAAGDAVCAARAQAAGLSGVFKAWLSTSTINAADRLTSNGPWARLDGVKVADTKADLTDGILFSPINVDDTLTYWGGFSAWTGTGPDGHATASTCSDWTSAAPNGSGTRGIVSDAGSEWSDLSAPCDRGSQIGLYCFED